MPQPLIFAALPPVGSAVILLILAAGAPHRAPAEQATRGVGLPIRPRYLLVVNSKFSKESLSDPQLDTLETRIVGVLGGVKERCGADYHSQAEVQKIIESDGQKEALYVDTTEVKGSKPKVHLWARGKDHHGKIADFSCAGTEGEWCVDLALEDFPAYVAKHDEDCHRGKQCTVDKDMVIVPLP